MQNALLNLTMLAFLFLLFVSIGRGRRDGRLALWSSAWLLLLLNGALALWNPASFAAISFAEMVHLTLLSLASMAFLLSFVDTAKHRVLLGVSLFVPVFCGIVLVEFWPGKTWLLAGYVLVGEVVAGRQAKRLIPATRRLRLRAVQGIGLAAGLLMLAMIRVQPSLLPELAIMQILLVDAVLLWTGTTRRTPGVVASTAGLVLWAAVFPAAWLFGELLPRIVVSPMEWNLPKFFVAFGMILLLHEEEALTARELGEKYRLLFDHHPLPMWVYSVNTLRFLTVNDAAIANYGFSRDEFAAMTIEHIRSESELPRLREDLRERSQGLTHSEGWRHRLRDGRTIEVDIFGHDLAFERQPARMVVAIDVTKRHAAEERIRQAYKLESLAQLTGGVAHDFNNILATLLGNLELLEQEVAGSESSRRHVEQSIASVHRGADVTKRLLAYARQQPLTPRVVDIARLLEEAVRLIGSSVGPGIRLIVECEPALWAVQIDPGQLEHALMNLAINARDAMGERGGALRFECRNLQVQDAMPGLLDEIVPGDYMLLTITDNGCGMPMEVIERATEPFFTTKPVGKGTGLGLSMVYGFMKQSGGHLRIESTLYVGTKVLLYLPRAHRAEAEPIPSQPAAARPLPRGAERILVVEDEHGIRTVLVQSLRKLGYAVLEAEDGPAAMIHLTGTPGIDLLLTDIVLPNGISGGLLAKDARRAQPEIKVLFSSGYTRNALIRDRRLEEGVHLLTKPFRLAEMAAMVRDVLDNG